MPQTADALSPLKADSPKKVLFDAIQTVGKAVSPRSPLAILNHMAIVADSGRITLMATDLELWLSHSAATQSITSYGAGTVPARNFTDLVSALPDSDVQMAVDPETHTLTLKCNRATYKLLGLPHDEFPRIPQVKEDSKFTVDRATLRDAIKQTLFATSSDETRAILTGVLMVYQGDSLRLVATDTHRLAVRDCAVHEGTGSATAIVPHRAMHELARIISTGEGTVSVTISSNQIQFETTEPGETRITLISRLIEGQFPNYERVIPSQATRILTLEREPLSQAVRRAAIVARDAAHRIVLRTTEDGERLSISAESGLVGNAYEEVEVARDGDLSPVEIAFNAKYLSDALAVIEGEGIKIELTELMRPSHQFDG